VGALGGYLEAAGVATTQISLIREHTEAISPPRALWVSFMLGRPFGVPNDARFQERVLRAALGLLEAPQGPVLQDPEDAPAAMSDVAEGQVCPVSFAHELDEADLRALFVREVEALGPWYGLARNRRGRSAVGLSAGSIDESAALVAAFVKGEHVSPPEGLTLCQTLKLACEDVRAYYYRAAAARPGDPDAKAIDQWFWRETAAGGVFLAFQKLSAASDEQSVRRLAATSIVPRSVLHDQAKA
jgi:hypothetical protein